MAANFPTSPNNGQQYEHNGRTWTYDSTDNTWSPHEIVTAPETQDVFDNLTLILNPSNYDADDPIAVKTGNDWIATRTSELGSKVTEPWAIPGNNTPIPSDKLSNITSTSGTFAGVGEQVLSMTVPSQTYANSGQALHIADFTLSNLSPGEVVGFVMIMDNITAATPRTCAIMSLAQNADTFASSEGNIDQIKANSPTNSSVNQAGKGEYVHIDDSETTQQFYVRIDDVNWTATRQFKGFRIRVFAIRGSHSEDSVQSDWNETDNTQSDFIKNKPTIPEVYSQVWDESASTLTPGSVTRNITLSPSSILSKLNAEEVPMVWQFNTSVRPATENTENSTVRIELYNAGTLLAREEELIEHTQTGTKPISVVYHGTTMPTTARLALHNGQTLITGRRIVTAEIHRNNELVREASFTIPDTTQIHNSNITIPEIGIFELLITDSLDDPVEYGVQKIRSMGLWDFDKFNKLWVPTNVPVTISQIASEGGSYLLWEDIYLGRTADYKLLVGKSSTTLNHIILRRII